MREIVSNTTGSPHPEEPPEAASRRTRAGRAVYGCLVAWVSAPAGRDARAIEPALARAGGPGYGGVMVQFFDSDGLRIAFIDVAPEGRDRGEPILLIHGFASNHRINWVNPRWVETLTKAGRRVIAFDNRGHGESDKPTDPAAYHSATMARDARQSARSSRRRARRRDGLFDGRAHRELPRARRAGARARR